MLVVERVIRVRCTMCKSTFTYQDENMVPDKCPSCMDGAIVDPEYDALEEARTKRMYEGTATYYKKFKV